MDAIDITSPTWPPIELLLSQHKLPSSLEELIARRYLEHGGEYATDQRLRNGTPINACMFKDNLQDVEEELTDAVFNALVFTYRSRIESLHDTDHGEKLLNSCLEAWKELQRLRVFNGKQDKEVAQPYGKETATI